MTPKHLVLALCLAALPLAAAGPDPLPHTHCEPAAMVHHYALGLGGGIETAGSGHIGAAGGIPIDGSLEDCDGDGIPGDADYESEHGLGVIFLSATHHDSTICVQDASGNPIAFGVQYESTITTAGHSHGECITVGPDPLGWNVYPWNGAFHHPDGSVLVSAPTFGDVW